MKRIFLLLLLVASPALAQTTIVEYPDHFYVESTGVAEAGSVVSPSPAEPENRIAAPIPAPMTPAVSTAPTTNYQEPKPTPADRRAALEREKQRLSREYVSATEQDPAALQSRRESLARKMRKIDSELLKVPVQFD